MAWKGDIKNRNNGRPVGSKNKTTQGIRKLLEDFLTKNLKDIQQQYDSLEAKEKLIFLDKIARHVLPPPLHELEKLTEEQLKEVISSLRNGHQETKMYSHD